MKFKFEFDLDMDSVVKNIDVISAIGTAMSDPKITEQYNAFISNFTDAMLNSMGETEPPSEQAH